ncbi:uncharacterized protein B0P05DRAFT_560822 [Gilbertella persicaria]|uniref:uncharacterized protein n=1 Tax=Gilbertella persicaria TaxID=101096 RepID=UPI00221EF6FB|nr:uncharacterized protein B0P05DRAFT_560822 [Gilbertella persicaria]KAI8054937.1 hypothetical protein B0P05DRAFT_560822 [Gilbertella persicaria]
MNITSTLPPSSSSSAFRTPMSTLSNSDRSFIEFTRCLYKIKSIVQELEVFSHTVRSSLDYQQETNTQEFIRYVQQYLENSFKKFNHMCRILLYVLSKLESNQTVKRERIDSFRQEVTNEWRKANFVRQDLVLLVHRKHSKDQFNTTLPSPSSLSNHDQSSNASSSIDSSDVDEDVKKLSSSESSLEPNSSQEESMFYPS